MKSLASTAAALLFGGACAFTTVAHAETVVGNSFQMDGLGWFSGGACYQVTFVDGGGSNFCVPRGQNHYMWLHRGDWACRINLGCPNRRDPILIVRQSGSP